jgi:hypothetical protein
MLLMNLDYMGKDKQLLNNMDNQVMVEIDDNNLHQDPKAYLIYFSNYSSSHHTD